MKRRTVLVAPPAVALLLDVTAKRANAAQTYAEHVDREVADDIIQARIGRNL